MTTLAKYKLAKAKVLFCFALYSIRQLTKYSNILAYMQAASLTAFFKMSFGC